MNASRGWKLAWTAVLGCALVSPFCTSAPAQRGPGGIVVDGTWICQKDVDEVGEYYGMVVGINEYGPVEWRDDATHTGFLEWVASKPGWLLGVDEEKASGIYKGGGYVPPYAAAAILEKWLREKLDAEAGTLDRIFCLEQHHDFGFYAELVPWGVSYTLMVARGEWVHRTNEDDVVEWHATRTEALIAAALAEEADDAAHDAV